VVETAWEIGVLKMFDIFFLFFWSFFGTKSEKIALIPPLYLNSASSKKDARINSWLKLLGGDRGTEIVLYFFSYFLGLFRY
jgi:hypothetical protein